LSYQPIKTLGNINATIQAGLAAANRVFALLNLKTEKIHIPKNKKIPEFKKQVVFNNVHFTYPETKEKILNGVSFQVNKGEIIAIVGSSGSGKSTILDLLPRFYDIQEGSITIDNKNIMGYNLGILRELFGIVSQETILFDDTIKANIAYGTTDASEKEIIGAAETANAMEFIDKLPEKLDTIIGERGVTLSGGQCQRLSIARAILKNPQILILDEATSALDTESEKLVQNAINNLVQNRTTFIVAHRLSTIQHADKIVILEEGKIIEQGTHSELIKLGKRYKYFYDLQFTNTNKDDIST
jgi:subfamily B ATP-binding cassette protein MsbA